ncbi:MAG TPA: condensation domain-containing protein, partial [Myxococcaceae bacterium]|nr:condensation domain-containing protein [Myxococcaceae bacterium]
MNASRRKALLEARLEQAGLRGRRIPRRTGSGPWRLSFAQQRLWLLDQLSPGGALYNVPLALRLRGELDEGALEASLARLAERHEALRTRFAAEGGVPYQVVEAAWEPRLERHDLNGEADVERALEAGLASEARRGFDLSRLPLMRASLWRLGERDQVLVLLVHHIVFDGWSAGVVARELGELYGAYRSGREARLGELEIQYADYAEWQREELAGERLERQLGYWRERLTGAAALELPADRPRPPVQRFAGAHEIIFFSRELKERVAALARQEGCTVFHVLTAAAAVLLARYSGLRDVVIGTAVANRDRAETAGVVGCFLNTLVMRFDLSGDPTFAELLGQVRRRSLEALSNQDVPFERLVEELRPARDPSRNPLFQVLVTYLNAASTQPALDGLEAEQLLAETETAALDL